MKQPNALAWLALYGWPFVVLGTFALRRSSARLARTTAWMMLLPVMFLPALLKLPFAGLDKHRISFLAIAAALLLFHRQELRLKDGWRRLPLLILLVFCLGAVQTLRTNADPLRFGILRLPGLGPRDLAWMIYEFFVDMVLPFAIGQRVFKNDRDARDLLEVLGLCVLAYAPLCLIEMRLSPQLSTWVYGYFPHSFAQTARGAGYRPVVFMNHGLSVGMFLFAGLCAALTLRTLRSTARAAYTLRSAVALAILLLARNLASIVYSVLAVLLHLLGSAQFKARLLLALTALLLAYPVLRATDSFPTTAIGELAGRLSPERSASLVFRFDHEGALLARALERPWFGWGGWGRSRLYSSWGQRGDEWAGFKDVSVTDGTWIIWLGTSGLVGFAAHVGLLVLPIWRFARNRAHLPHPSQVLAAGLAGMVTFFSVDLLPNSLSDFTPLVYAGALFALSAPRPQPRKVDQARPP